MGNYLNKLLNLLSEGVDDPGILKAVLLAGGPGSGKSAVSSSLLGIPDGFQFTHSGLKLINSDIEYVNQLKKAGVDPKDLGTMSKDDLDKLTDKNNPNAPRTKAKDLTNKREELFKQGRLGLILDGTGKDINKIKKQKEELEALGYDTLLVFVSTSLAVALERNKARSRSLPDDFVKSAWNKVMSNKDDLKDLFGDNFVDVVNDASAKDDTTGKLKLSKDIESVVDKFVSSPVSNPIGKKFIADAGGLLRDNIRK